MKFLMSIWLALSPEPPVSQATTCANDCAISQSGVALVQHFEGYMPFVYKDAAGLDTIGWGHLVHPGETFQQPLLPDSAEKLLRGDLRASERGVNRHVAIPLLQNQFDALTSWTFNLGVGALQSSTMLKRVNAERHDDVPVEMLRWNKARVRGVLTALAGLTRRREAEGKMYAG